MQDIYYARRVQFSLRKPIYVLSLVLLWRVALLVFTVQPIPANDAFGYDGGVVNYLHTGHYCNPSMALVFPITGREVFSNYPPGYQGVLLVWMKIFGTTVVSAMVLHLVLFAIAASVTLAIVQKFFPAAGGYALATLLFFGFTFGDRPEDLAYVLGLGSLWLGLRQISRVKAVATDATVITLLLVLMLYTSPIVGAYFFGIGFLTSMMAWWGRRRMILLVPFFAAAGLFVMITFMIARTEPRWWAGFMESSRQQSVMSVGFHAPRLLDLIKLARTAPVFLVGLLLLPLVVARRKEIFSGWAMEDSGKVAWLPLVAAIFIGGWGLLVVDMTLLAANYVGYVLYTQVILAAGMLALAPKLLPKREGMLRVLLLGCVLLISVRAVGMTTWGAACAWKNSYGSTHETLRTELAPYAKSDALVLVSSAFLYSAAEFGVKNAVNSDWYFDHATWTNDADLIALVRLRPQKLALTQFDYYRSFAALLERLRDRPEIADIRVCDFAGVRTPDSIPSLQRVVQHISWAPVMVDLEWRP